MEFAETLDINELDTVKKLAEAKAEAADPNTKYLSMKEVFEGLREKYTL